MQVTVYIDREYHTASLIVFGIKVFISDFASDLSWQLCQTKKIPRTFKNFVEGLIAPIDFLGTAAHGAFRLCKTKRSLIYLLLIFDRHQHAPRLSFQMIRFYNPETFVWLIIKLYFFALRVVRTRVTERLDVYRYNAVPLWMRTCRT